MAGNNDVNMNNVLTEVATRIGKTYELEADFIDTIKQIVKDACAPYFISAKTDATTATAATTQSGGKKPRAKLVKKEADPNKGPRKVTPYNVYMQEQSPLEKAKGTPTNQRLAAIGASWKTLSDADKKVYQDKANAVNLASATAASDTASVVTAP